MYCAANVSIRLEIVGFAKISSLGAEQVFGMKVYFGTREITAELTEEELTHCEEQFRANNRGEYGRLREKYLKGLEERYDRNQKNAADSTVQQSDLGY